MPLDRAQVLRAALRLLDASGLAGLSMRRVAGDLGVRVGALYHHVPDKQALLAGVADLVLAEVPEPIGLWRPALEDWAHHLRATLLLHRDSAEVVATARGSRLLRHDTTRHPAILLTNAGLPASDARGAASSLLHLVLGHVAEEQARLDLVEAAPEGPGGPARREPPDVASDDASRRDFALGVVLVLDGVEDRLGVRGAPAT